MRAFAAPSSAARGPGSCRAAPCTPRSCRFHSTTKNTQRAAKRGARGGSQRDAEEEVEIFNFETGWNVEAITEDDIVGLDDLASSDDDEPEYDSEDEGLDEEGGADAEAGEGSPGGQGRRRAGGGGSRAVDQLLASLPPHLLRRLEAQQLESDEINAALAPAAQRKAAQRRRTHRQLRIIAGAAAGTRLLSPQGDQTRPMMEMVRNAVFNMITAMYGVSGGLPEHTRWLDLFAGTGAVGLEALSRGAGEAHFVELDPWVIDRCLNPNLEASGLGESAVVHRGKAEDFLRRAAEGGAAGMPPRPFDFVSVCPPYELVDYAELYDLLEESPLLHGGSLVLVEYPRKLLHLVRDSLGPLRKLRDRRYGRTFLALYGPADLAD